MKIRLLDDHVINKIAAGEVIENSASVVKELVENAIDADSTEIFVEIQAGGRQLIRITDNGCGMSRDDALLSLERHATSKLKQIDDLEWITTMGFRGEAVPSIASISKFTLMTSEGEGKGTMILVDGGKILSVADAVKDRGTTIEVKQLFFNVPVRKKYQKSFSYDTKEVLKVLSKMALAHPEISFTLISDKEQILEAPAADIKKRAEDILGEDFILSTCPIEVEFEGVKVSGFVGFPSFNRHNKSGQYLYINKRPIYSRVIQEAIREGYGTALGTGRHPIYLLYVEMPSSDVDVNVHPQKREVRLRQDLAIREGMARTLLSALHKESATPAYEPEFTVDTSFAETNYFTPRSAPLYHVAEETLATYTPERTEQKNLIEQIEIPEVIGLIEGYILLEGEEGGVSIVDQRRAHHRVVYEKLLQSDSKQAVQGLLIPYTFEVSPNERSLILDNLTSLKEIGFGIEDFGKLAFSIDAVPQCFQEKEVSDIVRGILDELHEYQSAHTASRQKEVFIGRIASKGTISRTKKLHLSEAKSLISQLYHCDTPFMCPYGKPTMITLGKESLEKQFLG